MLNKLQALSSMTFGQRIAEEEGEALAKYFVETDHWRRLYAGEVDIVYGSKGSGKSALYALLLARREALFERSIILASAENPRGTPAFKGLITDPPATEQEFIGLWKLYFAILVADVFTEYDINSPAARKLRQILEREGLVRRGKNLTSLLRSVVDYIRSSVRPTLAAELNPLTGAPEFKITLTEPSAAKTREGFLSVDQLLDFAEDALQEQSFDVWIVLDRLDVAFAENPALEQNALRALFHAYLDLLGCPHLHLKIFLRTDIWRRITEAGFREASHITRDMTLSWQPAALLNLIVRRAIQNKSIQDFYQITPAAVLASAGAQEAFFNRLFPPQIAARSGRAGTFGWMLNRTQDGTRQTAPRELIHLLNALREVQVRHFEVGNSTTADEELFTAAAFSSALSEVSRVRLEQTLFAEYPQLRSSLEMLRGEKTQYSVRSLAKLWKVTVDTAENIAQELTGVGFFEQRGTKDEPDFWVPFLYRDALGLVQGSMSE